MSKIEKLQKEHKDLVEAILAFVPSKDIKLIRIQLNRLHNLGAMEVLEKLDEKRPN